MENKYIKKFDEWNEKVKVINERPEMPYYSSGDVWWCALGVNVGSEQDGKNENFERPVTILIKMMDSTALIAPITSTIKSFNDRHTIVIQNKESQILLSQTKTISTKRLMRKISTVKKSNHLIILVKYFEYLARNITTKGETPQTHKVSGENLGGPNGPTVTQL